jgi:hypothetical protein
MSYTVQVIRHVKQYMIVEVDCASTEVRREAIKAAKLAEENEENSFGDGKITRYAIEILK